MAISTLIVAVRTTGAAALAGLGAGFTALNRRIGSATLGFRSMGAQGARTAAQLRGQITATNRSIAVMSQRLSTVRGSFGGLRQNIVTTAAEVQRLDRLVRFMGQGASQDLRDRLAAAQIAAMQARAAFGDARTQAAHLAAAIRAAQIHASGLGNQLRRIERWQSIGRTLTNGMESLAGAIAAGIPMLGRWGAILGAVAVFGTPLIAVVVSLAGAVQLLPPALIAAASAFAALKLALTGVSGAISAGLSGDTEEYRKALKKLTPAAREFVQSAVMLAPAWRNVQRATQQALFAGGGPLTTLAHRLRQLNIEFQPVAMAWLPAIADGFGRAASRLAAFLIEPATKSQIVTILANVKRFLDGILNSITPLTQAFLDIAEVAAPAFGDLGASANTLAEKFAAWIRQLKDNGTLAAWLNTAKEAFRTLGQIAGDLGRMLGAIWKGGQEQGQTFLQRIREITDAFATWLNSDDGQEMIDFLGFMANAALRLIGVVVFLGQAWIGMMRAVDAAFRVFVTNALTVLGVFVNGAARAFGWLPTIGPQLQNAAAQFNAFRDQVNAALNGIQDENVVVNVIAHTDGSLPRSVQGSLSQGKSIRAARFAQHGGSFRPGETAVVGERGWEVVTFGRGGGGQVHSHGASARMLAGGGAVAAGDARVELVAGPGGGGAVAELIASLVRSGALRLQVRSGGARVGVVTVG